MSKKEIIEDIPEITINLKTCVVRGESIKLPYLRIVYKKSSLLEKFKFRWYWFWNCRRTKTWDTYLDSQINWIPGLAEDLTMFYDIDSEKELTELLAKNIWEEMGEEEYQSQQLDIAKQIMDQTYPSWSELQSESLREEIDAEILKQLKESNLKRYGITSMYGNPIHPGHIECLMLSKELVDELWVIVNNDKQAELKRGVPSFQDETYRKTVIESIRYVDHAEIAIDQDGSVCETIKLFHDKIKSLDPESEIIFTKGGDRFANEIPEKVVCDSLGIKIVDGLGLKTHNSSDMINKK